jgi:two-component system chemotaxis response regulator CheB
MGKSTEIVVIGGSAGSLQVILDLLKKLNENLSFPIIIVVHRKANSSNVLPILLQQYTEKTVLEAEDKTELQPNHVYVVPADYHLLFEDKNIVSLDSSEKINYSRPSIDVTFRMVAEIFRDKAVAVLLSGANADGVEGLQYILRNGGKVWIQDPKTAEVDYMPQQALKALKKYMVITPQNLAENIIQLEKM